MFSLVIRRIVTVGLIVAILFFGTAFNLNVSQMAIADSITRDVTNLNTVDEISDAKYEAAKIDRQQKQRIRSEQAEQAAERAKENEPLIL